MVISEDKERLLRLYAAGSITWSELQDRGFASFVEVLGGLGDLGLRQPIASMTGPNVAARERGLSLLRDVLKAQTS
jgi:hypothetical protein